MDNSSFGSCSSSLAHDTDEATSASSWVARDADDAMSEPSWTALTKRKERDWWGIDLEGEMAKLEVVCPWSGTECGSVNPKGKIGHWSVRTRFANEESEEPNGAENEKQKKEMEVDEAAPHEASAEIQSNKRKVIRVESQETQDHVPETLAISKEEAEEMGFVPSALGEPRGAFLLVLQSMQ